MCARIPGFGTLPPHTKHQTYTSVFIHYAINIASYWSGNETIPYHGLLSNSIPLLFSTASPLLHMVYVNTPYLTHNTTCSTLLKHDQHKNHTQGYANVYYPASIQRRYVCVVCCVCVCACVCVYVCVYVYVCYGEIACLNSSLANWCMVLCIYIYICK